MNLVSNVCVQSIALNTGPLKVVESDGRYTSPKLKTHCITGTLIIDDDPVMLNTDIPSPIADAIYKIHAYEINPVTMYYDAYFFENSPSVPKDPELCRCTVASINYLSGFNFLSNAQVNFFTKSDKVTLPWLLLNLTNEKDVTPLLQALKDKDNALKDKDKQIEAMALEIKSLKCLVRSRDSQIEKSASKRAKYNACE